MRGKYDLAIVNPQVGRGSRGTVQLVKHKEHNHVLALKVVDVSDAQDLLGEMQAILTECHVHKSLVHANIIE